MRNVGSHLLEDKMDEAVTHYINSHQSSETVHVDASALALNVQVDTGRVVTVMHGHGFSTQMSRQVSVSEQVGDGPWTEELLDSDERLDALVAHLAQHSRASHQANHHKVSSVRGDVDTSVILDTPLRLFNGQSLGSQSESIVVQVPHLPPLPPLQEMKRCPETDWFNKTKNGDSSMLSGSDEQVLELSAGASPAHSRQHSKKSLPHKKRISRKLKRNTGNTTPQQDIVMLSCSEEVPQEEILPDNFVGAQPQEHLPDDSHHHITHEVRALFICQLCGEFYGEEQLKFYQHLRQHYEPHDTIIIENPASAAAELNMDKMSGPCLVDAAAALPDSIVELSLESTVPKTVYQHIDKHIMYTTTDKAMYSNKLQYSMANMSKDACPPCDGSKAELYDSLEMFSCSKCSRSFRKQRHCEAHIKEAHGAKLEDMGEFSEPEDLMEGIHVAVAAEEDHYEHTLLPTLTVDSGHVHQEHGRTWYMRGNGEAPLGSCGADGAYCPVCPAPPPPPPPPPPHHGHHTAPPTPREHHSPHHLKEEVLQRIFEVEGVNPNHSFPDTIITESAPVPPEPAPPPPLTEQKSTEDTDKKKIKRFECPHCSRVFHHRNSLLYHVLSHGGKQQMCRECGKGFYTAGALKIHKRVHNGDRPYKCDDCGRDFRQWSDLKYHRVSLHSDQKHFKCEFCGKEFARKYSLNVHRRIHTGERNYKCEYCNKSFRASSYRLSHMRTHTGDKPHKCVECEKCFRVAGDLRRHMLTHEKVRNRFDEQTKLKQDKLKKLLTIKTEPEPKTEPTKHKKTIASRQPPPKDKKQTQQKSSKKSLKKISAPNVTVQKGQFKLNEYTNNVEVFDTRQDYDKFKEVYTDTNVEYSKDSYKDKEYEQVGYKDNERLSEDRDFAVLRPMFRNACNDERQVFEYRPENTDGKLQVFTQVEKTKEYDAPVTNSVTLNDVRNIERERELNGETMENGFLDKLTAFYNIPAV